MIDASQTIQRLRTAEPLREPLLREVIASLQLPPDSAGLDAGCGIGLQALLLAEAVGPQGHVTGVDVAPELLAFGRDRVRQAGYAGRVTLLEGDVTSLLFDDDRFDWAWSADCVASATRPGSWPRRCASWRAWCGPAAGSSCSAGQRSRCCLATPYWRRA